jgi:hypothetical protein
MVYTELYLRIWRENHNSEYVAMDNLLADIILEMWQRANYAIHLSEAYPNLGLSDSAAAAHVPELIGEIDLVRAKVGPTLTIHK